MSFFKLPFRSKILLRYLFLFVCIVTIGFFGSPNKTYAFLGVGDISFDPPTEIETALTAIPTTVSAAANTISTANSVATFAKEFVLDGLANYVAKTIIRGLTAQTVNWINSGFKGNPAFVTNPDTFFLNVGDNVASRFLSSNGVLNNLCSPFKAQVQLKLVKDYLQDTDPTNYSCTLGKIEQNYDNFTRDFNNGGWDAWFQVTQNNKNNPYGSYLEAQNELSVQIGNNQNKYNKQLDWGKGFLSYQRCTKTAGTTAPKLSDSSGDATVGTKERQCIKWAPLQTGKPSQCLQYQDVVNDSNGQGVEEAAIDGGIGEGDCTEKETVTPGSVIEGQLEKVLGSTVSQLELTNQINQVVSALMTQLVSQVVGGIGNGLKGLSESNASQPRSFIEQINTGSPETTQADTSFGNTVQNGVPSNLKPGATPLWTPPAQQEIETNVDSLRGKYPNGITPGTVTNGTGNNQTGGAGGADTQPPTIPTSLRTQNVAPTQVDLIWTGSTDNFGVTGYQVYKNGTLIGTPSTASYSDINVVSKGTYSYFVTAYDASGNISSQSNTVSVTTP